MIFLFCEHFGVLKTFPDLYGGEPDSIPNFPLTSFPPSPRWECLGPGGYTFFEVGGTDPARAIS